MSGALSLLGTGLRVNIVGGIVSSVVSSPADAAASYTLSNAGVESSSPATISNTWVAGSASNYDVRVTVNSGAITGGTAGSWLNLGTTRTWSVVNSNNTPGTLGASLTVEIRSASSLVVLDTATVTLSAEVA